MTTNPTTTNSATGPAAEAAPLPAPAPAAAAPQNPTASTGQNPPAGPAPAGQAAPVESAASTAPADPVAPADSAAAAEASAEPGGVRGWFREQVGDMPEFVTTARPSLQQLRRYSEAGDWAPARSGSARAWHLRYTRLVAIPVAAAAYATQWAAERPGRFAFVVLVLVVLCTALNSVPVLELLIPDWMSLTYWPPLSWF